MALYDVRHEQRKVIKYNQLVANFRNPDPVGIDVALFFTDS